MPRDRLHITVHVDPDDYTREFRKLRWLMARLITAPFEVTIRVVSHTDPPPSDRWVEGPPSGG